MSSWIIEAVRDWEQHDGDRIPVPLALEGDGTHRVIGRCHPRSDAPDKVTGRAVFTEDIQLPNMLHGKVLTSPHAHARIESIVSSVAEALQ